MTRPLLGITGQGHNALFSCSVLSRPGVNRGNTAFGERRSEKATPYIRMEDFQKCPRVPATTETAILSCGGVPVPAPLPSRPANERDVLSFFVRPAFHPGSAGLMDFGPALVTPRSCRGAVGETLS